MLIHITGAPGAGKTTLGNWIKSNFKVKVIDIDDILDEFIAKRKNADNFKKDLQSHFDNIIHKHKKLVLVGLNYPDPVVYIKGKEHHLRPFKINIDADYKFYLDTPLDTLIKQRFKRELIRAAEDSDELLKDILRQKKKVFEIDIQEWIDGAKEWRDMYDDYEYLSSGAIKKRLKKVDL
jgi:adenylate kinase family enzyme